MDQALLIFFNQTLAHPFLDLLMIGATYLGLAALPTIGIGLLFSRQRRVGLAIVAALAGGLMLTFVFQYMALRPRPEHVRLLVPTPNFPSFPSGHAMAAFATATILMLAYRRRSWQALALGSAGLISLSRVYLGVHYPSDIVAGAMLGAGVGAASYGLLVARQAGQIQWAWLLWLQIALVGLITEMAYLALLPWSLLTWPLADKVLHFTLFGLVVFWLNLWLDGKKIRLGYWLVPLAILLPLFIASSEEIAQAWSPVRTASLSDWLCDLSGMLFFWWLSTKVQGAKPYRLFTISDFRFTIGRG